jgi:hypothetical protein
MAGFSSVLFFSFCGSKTWVEPYYIFFIISPSEALRVSWHPLLHPSPYCFEGGRDLDKLAESKA